MARAFSIKTVYVEMARKAYPFAAEQADLTGLAAKWGVTAVRCCIALDKDNIRLAREFVNLFKGCLGMVRQFALNTGVPHFCHKDDVGKIVRVPLSSGKIVFHQLFVPLSLNRNSPSDISGDDEAPITGGATRSAEEQGMFPHIEFSRILYDSDHSFSAAQGQATPLTTGQRSDVSMEEVCESNEVRRNLVHWIQSDSAALGKAPIDEASGLDADAGLDEDEDRPLLGQQRPLSCAHVSKQRWKPLYSSMW